MSPSTQEHRDAVQYFYDRLSPHFRRLWGPHLHDGYYETGKETRAEAQGRLVEVLASHAAIPVGARVLDVGCGMGATSVWLAKHLQCRPTGVTLSPVQVEMAQKLAEIEGVEADFLVRDAESLEFPHPFDAIWMVGVLGHLCDQESFVRNAHRLVRPGGRFLLADWTAGVHAGSQVSPSMVRPMLDGMLMPDIRSVEDYSGWFAESGFRIVKTLDLTALTRKTWDDGINIVQAPSLLRLAMELGADALNLVSAIHHMKRAMRDGLVRYGVVVAERV